MRTEEDNRYFDLRENFDFGEFEHQVHSVDIHRHGRTPANTAQLKGAVLSSTSGLTPVSYSIERSELCVIDHPSK